MNEENYKKRELDAKFGEVHERFSRQDQTLEKILSQTTKTNGRVTSAEAQLGDMATKEDISKVNRILLIVGCITGTLLITNGSELIKFLMSII